MKYTGEFVVPWEYKTGPIMGHHLMRYAWASLFCYNTHVVDLGCGTGYGSYILSMTAKSVVGYDINPRVIDYAQENFRAPNLKFVQADIEFASIAQDVNMVIAFEVLEHLDSDVAESIIHYMTRRKKGLFLFSVPVEKTPSQFHLQNWETGERVKDMVLKYDKVASFLYQNNIGDISPNDTPATKYVLGIVH